MGRLEVDLGFIAFPVSFLPRIKYGMNFSRATEGRRSEQSERAHPVFS
jgi:hypothetical protein